MNVPANRVVPNDAIIKRATIWDFVMNNSQRELV